MRLPLFLTTFLTTLLSTVLASLLAIVALGSLAGCSSQPALPEACDAKPQSGRCRAAIPRYWFDERAGECRAFIWGGCDGVVPFDTYRQCHTQCRPGVPLPEKVPGIKDPGINEPDIKEPGIKEDTPENAP